MHKAILLFFCLPAVLMGQEPNQRYLEAYLDLQPEKGLVRGAETLVLEGLGGDSLRLDAVNMEVEMVRVQGKPYPFRQTAGQLILPGEGLRATDTLAFIYTARPTKGLFFEGFDGSCTCPEQAWTFGQGDGAHHWVIVRKDNTDKLSHKLTLEADTGFTALANGQLLAPPTPVGGRLQWTYHQKQEHSPYLMALVLGRFRKDLFPMGTSVAEVYTRKDLPLVPEPFDYLPQMVNILEEATGVSWPWSTMRFVFVSDFRATGLENTGLIMLDESLLEPGTDPDLLFRVVAHEVAHHWFGNYITAETPDDFWFQEAFATFFDNFLTGHLWNKDAAVRFRMESLGRILADSLAMHGPLAKRGGSTALYYDAGSEIILASPNHFGLFASPMKDLFAAHPYGLVKTADFEQFDPMPFPGRLLKSYLHSSPVEWVEWKEKKGKVRLEVPGGKPSSREVEWLVYGSTGMAKPASPLLLSGHAIAHKELVKEVPGWKEVWDSKKAVAINPNLLGLTFQRYSPAEARWLCLHSGEVFTRWWAGEQLGEETPDYWRAVWESDPNPDLRKRALDKWSSAEALPWDIIRARLTDAEKSIVLARADFNTLADSLPAWGHHGSYQNRFLSHFRIALELGPSMLDSLDADYTPLILAVLGDTSRIEEVYALAGLCTKPFLREQALTILLRTGHWPENVVKSLLAESDSRNRIRRNKARRFLKMGLDDPLIRADILQVARTHPEGLTTEWLKPYLSAP